MEPETGHGANSARIRIDPREVRRPTQFLAAWLVALILIVGAFLGAARTIQDPAWAPGVLVVAAVASVLLFFVASLLLHTKYRAEIMDDVRYSEHRREERLLQLITTNLDQTLRLSRLDWRDVIFGDRSLKDAPREAQDQIVSLTSLLREQIDHLGRAGLSVDPATPLEHPALIAGRALMAEGRWKQAAPYFEQYVEAGYEDWQVYFAIGYCRGKSHDGDLADRAALDAYEHATRLAPENLGPLAQARLTTYRAAMLKRLRRLDEAQTELVSAIALLRQHDLLDTEEGHDAQYNLAGVLSLMGREDQAIEAIRPLQGTPYAGAIWAHRDDYFAAIKDRPGFKEALGHGFAQSVAKPPSQRLRAPGRPPEAAS